MEQAEGKVIRFHFEKTALLSQPHLLASRPGTSLGKSRKALGKQEDDGIDSFLSWSCVEQVTLGL